MIESAASATVSRVERIALDEIAMNILCQEQRLEREIEERDGNELACQLEKDPASVDPETWNYIARAHGWEEKENPTMGGDGD